MESSDKMEKNSPVRAQKKVERQSRQKEHVQKHCDQKQQQQQQQQKVVDLHLWICKDLRKVGG